MEADCSQYLKREEHEKICAKQHEAEMEWAREVVHHSEGDRKNLWEEVAELKKIPGRFQTWFIVLLCAGILAPYVTSRITSNGNDSSMRELKGYVAEIAGVVKDQQTLITEGNRISEENQRKLQHLEKRLGAK